MKNARGMLVGCYILIPLFLFLCLVGCERGYYRGDNRGDRHYYRDGRWYQRDSAGHEFVVAALAIGAIIDSLPPSHSIVVVENTPYYHDDNYYYRQHPNGGYVVVPAPAQINYNNRGARGDNSRNEVNRGQNH